MRVAICDDDAAFLDDATLAVRSWGERRGVSVEVSRCASGYELLSLCRETRQDLVLLDILMPGISGMDVARELRARDEAVRIAFLTSSPEYAVDSYEVHAAEYLLKPVSRERLERLLAECARERTEDAPSVVVRTAFGYQRVFLADVECAEARNKRVLLWMRDGGGVEAVEPLRAYEQRLTIERGFFKCHRSYLVNLVNVERFSATDAVMRSGRVVPVARSVRREFQEAYFAMRFAG